MSDHPYISYGGGINSTAMTILVLTDPRFEELREDLRIVFADTGAELPETLQYVSYFDRWLRSQGLSIERVCGGSLVDRCHERAIIPSRVARWCTYWFKLVPLGQWDKQTQRTIRLIGIDAGESHRVPEPGRRDRVKMAPARYPLIEADVDRAGCESIIREAGLEMPMKSGCWICPFQRKKQWNYLMTHHPDLFEQAVTLEENASGFARGFYLGDKPLRQWAQQPMLDFDEPCNICEVL